MAVHVVAEKGEVALEAPRRTGHIRGRTAITVRFGFIPPGAADAVAVVVLVAVKGRGVFGVVSRAGQCRRRAPSPLA